MFKETILASLTWDNLARAFRRVYQGYLVTLPVDAEWVKNHVERNCIDLHRSPLWLDSEGDVAGLALLGVRPPRGWIGGFGLAPEQRGKGLAAALLDAILTYAEGIGLTSMQLEVLQNNHKAYRTYESDGFETTRRVVTLTCPIDFTNVPMEGTSLREWRNGPPHSEKVVWQRELPWAAQDGGKILVSAKGWIRFRPDGRNLALLDGATADRAILQAMLGDLRHRYPQLTISMRNEVVGSTWYRELTGLDWPESLAQLEMRVDLDAPGGD